MAKQKMVLKVVAMEDAKRRSKALKTAVGLPGVLSASLDKDCLTVVGDGVDSVVLTTVLRRKMGSADLVSVGSVEEKKEEKKPEEKKKKQAEKKPATVAESNKITWQQQPPPPASYWIMYPPESNNYCRCAYNHCHCASDCGIM